MVGQERHTVADAGDEVAGGERRGHRERGERARAVVDATRGGRPSAADAWTGEPHVVGEADSPAEVVSGDGAVGELEAGPSAATDESGGTSARW